ncbi:transcriptional regulatory protein ZraR [Novipirellula galeiformis]|uniref:Transcriptional regulatory protein ZraR n=1 Tax=Novipirellula galeiformis TaxID=2528004 RepID=A0A5C6CP95_9BACT|nr:hypothetical protein [Novipirellula galeiformis]TWU26272.1 transcriptional regulatory protein ZraR [Novipirellula galeiformis]
MTTRGELNSHQFCNPKASKPATCHTASRRWNSQRNVFCLGRILAATDRDLAKDVDAKPFREDRDYCLAVSTIEVPLWLRTARVSGLRE